jgi:hypothetical protein
MLFSTTADAADNPMACVEITMPYVTSGMVMSLPADIEVRVLIGSKAASQKIDHSSGTPVLKHELDNYFRDRKSL